MIDPRRPIGIIVDFEQKFGNRESVKRGCEFLVSYISGLQRPLPEIAAQGFRVAVKYKEASALRDKLEIAEKKVVDFLDARDGTFKFLEYPIEHAVWGILHVYRDLSYPWEGGSAYEFVSGTLEWIDNFDSNYELFTKLLKEYFPNE